MSAHQIIVVGFLIGSLICGIVPGWGEHYMPEDVGGNRHIGNTEPVGEKFGGGIKIHENGEDTEIDLDPTGPGGN